MLVQHAVIRKPVSCVEKHIIQGTMPEQRRRGRPRLSWIGNAMFSQEFFLRFLFILLLAVFMYVVYIYIFLSLPYGEYVDC